MSEMIDLVYKLDGGGSEDRKGLMNRKYSVKGLEIQS